VARVQHLFRAPARRKPMEELSSARAVKGSGFAGCAHARPGGKRQVLLVDTAMLRHFKLLPGQIRENITVSGLEVDALTIGQRLKVGAAQLEVSLVCDPCEQIEAIRPGLMESMKGKRGMLCRVLRGGTIRTGDPIVLQKRRKPKSAPRAISKQATL
jgi:MOSC domain-containing protein YiiM